MSKILSSTNTWVGVRCRNVAHDWSYLGTNYIQSTGVNKNPNWCANEPSSGCDSEQCMHINKEFSPPCWNDITCGNSYKFICGLPVCGREQVISISN
jgi:hypothetical protein